MNGQINETTSLRTDNEMADSFCLLGLTINSKGKDSQRRLALDRALWRPWQRYSLCCDVSLSTNTYKDRNSASHSIPYDSVWKFYWTLKKYESIWRYACLLVDRSIFSTSYVIYQYGKIHL